MLRRIRGIEMTVSEVRAKFKFGGNKPEERRIEIAQRLAERDQGLDRAVRTTLLARLEQPSRRSQAADRSAGSDL
jgi:transcriptional regulator